MNVAKLVNLVSPALRAPRRQWHLGQGPLTVEASPRSPKFATFGWVISTLLASLIGSHLAMAESRDGGLRLPGFFTTSAPVPETLQQAPRWKTTLKAPTSKELAGLQRSVKPQLTQIGFPRLPAKLAASRPVSERPEWVEHADGGWSITLEVTSTGAKALRASVELPKYPQGTSLVFFDGEGGWLSTVTPADPSEPAPKAEIAPNTLETHKLIWSPTSPGATLFVEVRLPPGTNPTDIDFALGPVSHLLVSPLDRQAMRSLEKNSGECNLDVVCYNEYDQLRAAVSLMVFTTNGSTAICTGQLLSNGDADEERYYLSANHCLSSQTVADTLETYWYRESDACDSEDTSDAVTQVTGGADLVTTDSATDTTLLRLRGALDFPVFYAGWTDQLPPIDIFGIHHPAGDLKKISFGDILGYSDGSLEDFIDPSDPEAMFIVTQWREGTTEGGSSGSAIYDQQQRVVGSLYGGLASCETPDSPDRYGRFDRAYERNSWQAFLTLGPGENRITAAKGGTGTGTLTSSPSGITCDLECTTASAKYPTGSAVTISAAPSVSARFTGWTAGGCDSNPSPNECTVSVNANRTVTANFVADLDAVLEAIDDSGSIAGFEVAASGENWTVDETTSTAGGSSAASGEVADNESSALGLVVSGPGTLSFDWRVSSEADYDYLTVSVDDDVNARISGEQEWEPAQAIAIPSGQHTVTWSFEKDATVSDGDDKGWIDNVVYRTQGSEDDSVFMDLLDFLDQVLRRSEG